MRGSFPESGGVTQPRKEGLKDLELLFMRGLRVMPFLQPGGQRAANPDYRPFFERYATQVTKCEIEPEGWPQSKIWANAASI